MMSTNEDGKGDGPMEVAVAELGRALRARRIGVGMSQEEVCRAAGVARSWLSRVEAGRHGGAELQKVLDLADVLGLSLTLSHEGAPTPQATRPSAAAAAPTTPMPSPQVAEPAETTRSRLTEGDPFEHLFG